VTRARPRVLLVECGGSALALGRLLRDAGMVGSRPPEELREALSGVRIFALGEYAEPGANVFETPEKAAEWLAGGRSHTV